LKYQDISTLILSLTPTEKQHFKKSNDPKSDFVVLFDFINKHKEYNSEKFKEHLLRKKKKGKGNSKKYTSGYFSVIKKYLYQKIMETLRTIYVPRRAPYEMFIRSLNADILLEKGLHQLAKEEISTAKGKSFDSSFPIEKLMLLRRESIIQFYEDYQNYTLQEIHNLYDSRISVAEQLLLEIKYARIISILTFQYFKGKKDLEMVESFNNEDYMQNESLATEFGTKYLYNWLKAQFSEFQEMPLEAIHYFEKAIKIWKEHPNYIQAHPRMYLATCYTYLKYILQQRNPLELILKEGDLAELLSKLPLTQMDDDAKRKHQQLFKVGQLLTSYKEKNYEKVVSFSGEIIETLKVNSWTTEFTKILVHYLIASSFFQLERFKASNAVLSDLIYDENISLTSNPEYYNHVLVLNILVNYELGNRRYLKLEIKRIQKEIDKHLESGEFEQLFLKMMLQLTSDRFKDQKEKVFLRFRQRMKAVLEKNNEEDNVEFKIIMNWIEGKVKLLV